MPDLATFRTKTVFDRPVQDWSELEDAELLHYGWDVLVFPSSLGALPRFDADLHGVVLGSVEPENQMTGGAFDCDLDGDGFDDVLVWEGGVPGDGPRRNWVRIAFGSPLLAKEGRFERVLNLSWLGEGLNGVECGADIDGDGRDDATVRTEQDGTFWLDVDAAIDGLPLDDFARRRWSEPVRPIGDVDGDGYGDLQIFCCAWSREQIAASSELLVDLVVPGGPGFAGVDAQLRSITVDAPEGAQVVLEDGPWHADDGFCCDVHYRDLDGDGRPEVLLAADTLRTYLWPHEVLQDLRSAIRLTVVNVTGWTAAFEGNLTDFGGVGDMDGDAIVDFVTRDSLLLVPGTYPEVPEQLAGERTPAALFPAVYRGPVDNLLSTGDPESRIAAGVVWPGAARSGPFRADQVGSYSPTMHVSPDRDGDGTDDVLLIGCCALTEEQAANPNYMPLGTVVYGADLFPGPAP